MTSANDNRPTPAARAEGTRAEPVPDWLNLVARHVASTDFGIVQITVHGARVVQVDWTQRARFAQTGGRGEA